MVGRDKCQSGSDRARRDAKTDGPAVRPYQWNRPRLFPGFDIRWFSVAHATSRQV